MSTKPSLALTMGDPAGIGSEIILKALADSSLSSRCQMMNYRQSPSVAVYLRAFVGAN